MASRHISKRNLILACAIMALIGINVSLQQFDQDIIWNSLNNNQLQQVGIENYLENLLTKGVQFIFSDSRPFGAKEPRKLDIKELLRMGRLTVEDCNRGALIDAQWSFADGDSRRKGQPNAGIVKLAKIYNDRIYEICHDEQIRVIESALAKIESTNIQLVRHLASKFRLVSSGETDAAAARTASKTVSEHDNTEETKIVEACKDFLEKFPQGEITKDTWGSYFRDESILEWQTVLGVCHSLLSPLIKPKKHYIEMAGTVPYVLGMAGVELIQKFGGSRGNQAQPMEE